MRSIPEIRLCSILSPGVVCRASVVTVGQNWVLAFPSVSTYLPVLGQVCRLAFSLEGNGDDELVFITAIVPSIVCGNPSFRLHEISCNVSNCTMVERCAKFLGLVMVPSAVAIQ